MSVFDVRFSMAGLLILFNSSCELVRHGGIVMNEIQRTLGCIQLNLQLSYSMHLYLKPIQTLFLYNVKQNSQIGFNGMESRFSLVATFIYWDQYSFLSV